MKIQVTVTRSGSITNQADFPSMEEAQAWVDYHLGIGSFGIPAIYQDVQVLISEEVRGEVQVLQTPATFNEFGEELTPATYSIDPDGIITPAVYETQTILVREADSVIEILDITAQTEAEAAQKARIQAGRVAREDCQQVLDLIAGYNMARELTLAQISQLQSLMSAPEAALRAGRPTLAKQFIAAVVPDGILVTEEMKQDALSLLSIY